MAVEIVTDLSSLMTMHRLGILKEAADHFGKCYYPAEYLPAALREQNALVPTQPARKQAFCDIVSSIDSGRIHIATSERVLSYIDEHRPESMPDDIHSYGIADLLPGLRTGNMLSDSMGLRFENLSKRASGVDHHHPPLKAQDKIGINLSTLESLAREELMNPVVSSFDVYISAEDRGRLSAELSGWEQQQLLWTRQVTLWQAIQGDARFVPAPVTIPADILAKEAVQEGGETGEADNSQSWLPFHSVFLSNEKQIPLLVDDRCCQMFVHNTRMSPTAAFGTDSVLASLLATGQLSVKRAADAYLRMIGWRYRFLVLPVSVLLEIAKRSLHSAPGQDLLRVSRYVQDCMRDPGLFCGPEKIEPPTAMAQKLLVAWTSTLSNFVVTCWVDPDVPEESANALTSWALTQCLPAVPAGLGSKGLLFAELQPNYVLSHALIRASSKLDAERVNKALTSIASLLGISKRQYLNQVAEVADAIST